MDYYNSRMRSGDLARVISDCYQRLGRRATIDLLDDMNRLGFEESTRSGLSFATDDLLTPENKTKIIADADCHLSARGKGIGHGDECRTPRAEK